MAYFVKLAATTLEHVATWLVWLANTLGNFNSSEFRRVDREVHDVAKGRYYGHIQRYTNGQRVLR